MGKCGAMNNGTAVTGAMLALVATGPDVGRRQRKWLPAFDEPLWIVGFRRVFGTRDFSANGPIQMGDGFWTHGNSSLACEKRVPGGLNAYGSEARKKGGPQYSARSMDLPMSCSEYRRSRAQTQLDLPLDMLQVPANGVARAAADDGPEKQSREAGHSIIARSRDRQEPETPPACAVVIDQKP
jgi:hypothetical protein